MFKNLIPNNSWVEEQVLTEVKRVLELNQNENIYSSLSIHQNGFQHAPHKSENEQVPYIKQYSVYT